MDLIVPEHIRTGCQDRQDRQDRPVLAYSPHPLTCAEGREVLFTELLPQETIMEYLERTGLLSRMGRGSFTLTLNGRFLPRSLWHVTRPKPGTLINVYAVVRGGEEGKNPLRTIALIAVAVAAAWAGPALFGAQGIFAANTLYSAATTVGVAVIGGMIVNKLFPLPRRFATPTEAESPTYGLSGGSNQIRRYGPMPRIMGTHRFFPDFGAQPYNEFEGEDQVAYYIFHFGYNDVELSDFKIGNINLDTFQGTELQISGPNGRITLFPNNVDSVAGQLLTFPDSWITRTTPDDTVSIAVEISGSLFFLGDEGLQTRSVVIGVETRKVGDISWTPIEFADETIPVPPRGEKLSSLVAHLAALWFNQQSISPNPGELTIVNGSRKPLRRTFLWHTPEPAAYEVRVRRVTPDETDDKAVSEIVWSQLRAYQADEGDYTGQQRVALKIKASSQLSGQLDEFSCIAKARTGVIGGGTALDFDGTGEDKIIIGSGSGENLEQGEFDDLSIECWVNADAVEAVAGHTGIVTQGGGSGRFWVLLNSLTGNIQCNSFFGGSFDFYLDSGISGVGGYHHVVATFDRDGMQTLYVDGIQKAQVSIVDAAAIPWDLTSPFEVAGSINHALDGKVDGVRVYNRILSSTEVAERFVGIFKNETHRLLRWEFDDGSGTIPQDTSGNLRHGVFVGDPVWVTGGTTVARIATTSNPAWWYKSTVVGQFVGPLRVFGGASPLSKIDLDSIHEFATWCDTDGLSFNGVFDSQQSVFEILQAVSIMGRATPSWGTGKLGVIIDKPNLPITAIFGMHNIVPGTFEIQYSTEEIAEVVEGHYINPDRDWQKDFVRVTVPGATEQVRVRKIELFGRTSMSLAAEDTNLYAAQNAFRNRRYKWQCDWEAMPSSRGDVVELLHDLASLDYSGRFIEGGDTTNLKLSKKVPLFSGGAFVVIVKPDMSFDTYLVQGGGGDTDTLQVAAPLSFNPWTDPDHPPYDYKWAYGPTSTPGKKVKIESFRPVSERLVELSAIDEVDAYYNAKSGTFEVPDVLPIFGASPSITNLSIQEDGLRSGTGYVVKAIVTWNAEGDYSFADVRYSVAGDPLKVAVLELRGTEVELIIPDQTDLLVEVTAFGSLGRLGNSAKFSVSKFLNFAALKDPADVTNFAFTILPDTGVRLSWDEIPDVDRDVYEVWKGPGFGSGDRVFQGKTLSHIEPPLLNGTHNYFIKAFDVLGNPSVETTQVQVTINSIGAPTFDPPEINETDTVLSWQTPAMQFAIDTFEVRHGVDYSSGTLVGRTKGNSLKVPLTWTGSRTFWVAVKDIATQVGTAGSTSVTVNGPAVPSVSATLLDENVILEWTPPSSTLPIREYEIRHGTSYAAGTPVARIKGTRYTRKVDWGGTRTFWVTAYDSNENEGVPGSTSVAITVPDTVNIAHEVIDNNVLLQWTDAERTLPIKHYEVKRGPTFETSILIGTHGGRFAVLFENAQGTYTYWIVGVDSADNSGAPFSVTATVNQPPNYVLFDNQDSQFDSASVSNTLKLRGNNYVLQLDSSDTQYGQVPSVPDLDAGITGLTFEAWILPAVISQDGGIIEKTIGGDVNTCALLFMDASNARMRVDIAGLQTASASISAFPPNIPIFLQGRWDSTNGVQIAVNGVNQTTQAAAGTLDQGAGALYVGRLGTGVTYFFEGGIGPCRIYKRRITDTELLEHYHGIYKDETDLIAAWNFSEGEGTTAFDDTDNAYNLDLVSTPSYALSVLDGRNDLTLGAQRLLFPVVSQESASEYGTRTGYTTPQDAITAGFDGPLFPVPTTAQYVEIFDFGAVLPATRIVATLTGANVVGSVTIDPTLSVRHEFIYLVNRAWTLSEYMHPAIGDTSSNADVARGYDWEVTTAGTSTGTPTWPASVTPGSTTVTQNGVVWTARDKWTDFPDVWTTFTTNFRYLKVTLDISSAGGNHLFQADSFNIRLDVKLIDDAGMVDVLAADAGSGGTEVLFNVPFVDIQSIVASPMGTTTVNWVVNFVDTPNPTGFKLIAFDPDTGNAVDKQMSWAAKGV